METPISELCLVWYDFKYKYESDLCLKEIRPCTQNMRTILGSITNIIRENYISHDHFTSMKVFTLRMNKIFIWNLNIYKESGYNFDLDLLTILS